MEVSIRQEKNTSIVVIAREAKHRNPQAPGRLSRV